MAEYYMQLFANQLLWAMGGMAGATLAYFIVMVALKYKEYKDATFYHKLSTRQLGRIEARLMRLEEKR